MAERCDALIVTDWRSSLSSCRQSTSTWVASNRERVRALQALAERLAPYGFDGSYLFTGHSLRVLAEDTPGSRERDRETVEAWYQSKGRYRASEAEGAK
jgi:hypothetical protein